MASPAGLRRSDLIALAALGLVARSFNLGTFSLWLDEILLVRRATGTPAEVWRACFANAEHPPASALASALVLTWTDSELALRVLHLSAGLLAALGWSVWLGWRFGRRAGLAAGVAFMLSPFAVRYAQEIRPYAFLHLATAATLVVLAWGETRDRGRRVVAALAGCLVLGLYSHYLFALVLVPPAWMLAEQLARGPCVARRAARRMAVRSLLAAAVASLLFLPWLSAVARAAGRSMSDTATHWTWGRVAGRLHFLLAGGREGEPATAGGVALFALVVVGAAFAARTSAGRGLLAGAIAGLLGVELAFAAAGHWSSARYETVGWVFLVMLLALGAAKIGARSRWLFAASLLLIGTVSLAGLLRYDRYGRADWDRVAATVAALRRPGEPVIAENAWTAISLGHYMAAAGSGPRPLHGDQLADLEAWPAGACALLVTAGYPPERRLRGLASQRPHLAWSSASEARVTLLHPADRARIVAAVAGPGAAAWDAVAPEAASEPCFAAERRLGAAHRRPRLGRLDQVRLALTRRWRRMTGADRSASVSFDPKARAALLGGWSRPERTPDGRSFAWAVNGVSDLVLELGPPEDRRLRLTLRPFGGLDGPQTLHLAVNDRRVAEVGVRRGWQTLELAVPAEHWHPGANTLTLRFARTASPAMTRPGSRDRRNLGAAVDELIVDPAATATAQP